MSKNVQKIDIITFLIMLKWFNIYSILSNKDKLLDAMHHVCLGHSVSFDHQMVYKSTQSKLGLYQIQTCYIFPDDISGIN